MTDVSLPSADQATTPSARHVRLSISIVGLSPDGRAYGEDDEGCLFQIRDESDESFADRGRRLLGILRARAIAIGAWRQDASRLSLRAPWPIPAHFSANGIGRLAEVSLGVTLETKDARSEDGESHIQVHHTAVAPLATPRADRIRYYVELAHAAIRHEVDEFLFIDDERANDPHGSPRDTTITETRTADASAPSLAELARPRRVAKLTIAIERLDGEILAEDFIAQAEDESDQHFIARAVIVLEFLRLQSGTPRGPVIEELLHAWPQLPRTGLDREHIDRLEALVRSRTDLGDAVLAGLLAVYELHGDAGAVRFGTAPREILCRCVSLRDAPTFIHHCPADVRADLTAVSTLIAALEVRERREISPEEG